MDVVWVYINRGEQEELDYSIRSVQKNLSHGRLIVIGDKPNFDVEHIKPPINRMAMLSSTHDVINKLHCISQSDVSDDFILMNDDFFILQPTEVPIAHRGLLTEHHSGRRLNDGYTKTIKKTLDYLLSKGVENPLSYELHIPMVFNKQKLSEMFEDVIPRVTYDSPMLTRSLYGNLYNVGGEYMQDVKNLEDYKDNTFLSTNEVTFQREIGDYIRSLL